MISYETAEKLKKAGYPQEVPENRYSLHYCNDDAGHVDRYGNPLDPNEFYAPSLSELIDSIGGVFFELSKLKDGWACNDHYYEGIGETPDEAVAALWLELNKKLA